LSCRKRKNVLRLAFELRKSSGLLKSIPLPYTFPLHLEGTDNASVECFGTAAHLLRARSPEKTSAW
jgi:hypothetical protein